MVKTLKNLLLRNQKADDLETWYAASSARLLPSFFSNDDTGLTLTYLRQGQIWSLMLETWYAASGSRVLPSLFK